MCDYNRNCKKYKNGTCNEDNFCIRKFKLQQYFNMSNLPPVALEHIELWSNVDDEKFKELNGIKENIVDFVKDGKSLYICSTTCGNGKTSWAYKIAVSYINKMWSRSIIKPLVYFVNVSDMLERTKSSFDNSEMAESVKDMKNLIREADLVVWDDFGVKTLSEFDRDMILDLIDYRLSHKKSNIYTSNNLEGLTSTKYGDRLKSRVYTMSQKVILNGEDRRGEVNDSESSTEQNN